ncbi:hypothetical protein BH20ACT11_BH20ACT11_10240 [soil metagenome]
MKPDKRILDPETFERPRTVRGGVFLAVILAALLSLVLASAANPAAAENGPATTSETSQGSEQETVEVTYDEAELEMAGLINTYREEKGLEPLLVSDTASLAAKRHSEDMVRYGFMDHDSQDSAYFDQGASFDERLAESGYEHNTALAENIAAGAGVEETFEGWQRSPEHEKNMLDPDMEVIGIGLSTAGHSEGSEGSESSQEGEYDSYWTTDFGAYTDRTAAESSEIQAEPNPDEPGDKEEPASENPKNPKNDATNDQYVQGTKPKPEDEASTDDEAGSTGGGDGASGDSGKSGNESGDGENSVTEEQYSSGDEDLADEDSSKKGSSGDEEGDSGEQTTEESTTEETTTEQSATEQPSGDRGNEGSPTEPGGDRDCDTLADFDKSPFDPGFGSELSRLIRAKVDCKLAEAGIGGKEAQAGQDGTVAGSGDDTTEQKPDATSPTSDNGDGDQNVGPATDGSSGESAPESGDEPDDEPTGEPDEAAPAVLGPASTESATPDDNGRDD